MGLNGVTSASSVYGSANTNQTKSKDTTSKTATDTNQETPSAVYEKIPVRVLRKSFTNRIRPLSPN